MQGRKAETAPQGCRFSFYQGTALRQRALPCGVAQCGVDSQLWVPSLVDGVVIFRRVWPM